MPRPKINMAGQKINLLTVLSCTHVNSKKLAVWLCRCECGSFTAATGTDIRRGKVKSCGCLPFKSNTTGSLRHGQSGNNETQTYRCWRNMRYRCRNPKSAEWCDYGGRGIIVCDRWLNSYENFLADMGEASVGLSIERRDNSRGYEADNCFWATSYQQNRNRRPTGQGRRTQSRNSGAASR